MPQLVKGGKWVFGWTVVGPGGVLCIPPAAFLEYGFQPEEVVLFLRGSRSSGGFAIGRHARLAGSVLQPRFLGQARVVAGGRVMLPPGLGIGPAARLLVVRGSGLALGFLQHGPICEEAQRHPGIETFTGE